MKGIAVDLVDAALAADVTMENYGAVPAIDAHNVHAPTPIASQVSSTVTISLTAQSRSVTPAAIAG